MHAKRGLEAIEAHGILPNRLGVLVHGCLAPYWKLDDSIHALYNTHLLRELVYVKEITGKQWPESMMQLVLCANRLCTAARRQQRTLDPNDMAAFRTDYDAQVREGKRSTPKPHNSWDNVFAENNRSPPICFAASACTPTLSCSSSATRPCRSPITLASASCSCPRLKNLRMFPHARRR